MAESSARAAELACRSCGAPVSSAARFCGNCGTPLAAPGSDERKLVTIVFADVGGSTELGEQVDPERMRAILGEYFAAMAAIIESWGGTVEKYIGDAILAVFGVPAAREDDAVRALRAAREMLDRLDDLNDGLEERHAIRLAVRIGVNTGEVLAPAGGRAGGQFLVSGDAVNVAARLQQAAEPGTILVGDRSFAVTRQHFSFGAPLSLTVKGKREPVEARRLEGAPPIDADRLDRARGVRFQAPMVGRERELEALLAQLDDAVESQLPRRVVVAGPAGIGKSRLMREFIATASERHPTLAVHRGRCLSAGHGITFWALGEILRGAAGISLDEAAESAVEKLRRTAAGVLGPLNLRAQEFEETVSALATSANLALPDNPLEKLEPEHVAEEMARAWPRFISGLAAGRPVLIVFEDVHWADERMVGMLELLAARSRGGVVMVATARPDFLEAQPAFASGDDLTVLSLRPLTEAQSDRLVAELLGQDAELPALLAEIRQKADGNPFFLEEILQRLIDEGAIVQTDGRWQATVRAADVRLPDTIHGLLAARIDALPADEKALLQEAAVVGRIFWPGSLDGGAGSAADGLLRALERRGLIAARPTSTIEGQTEYIFRHVLIRDVAYANVPRARRARLHAAVGRWLERLAADRVDEFGELLAYHFDAAAAGEDADLAWADSPAEREELRRRAFDALVRAGDAARRRFAVDKALTLHGQALKLATGDAEAARADEALGDDYDTLFHMDEAVAHYFNAVDAARRAGLGDARIGALAAKVAYSAQRWGAFREPPPAERIRQLVDAALDSDVSDEARAELLISRASLARYGQYQSSTQPLTEQDRLHLPAAIASAEEGLAMARRIDDPALLHRAYIVLSQLYWRNGEVTRAREMVEQEADFVDRLPSRRQQVDVLDSIAAGRVESGRYEEGLAMAERAWALASDVSPHERMHASFTLMWAAYLVGRWGRVLEVLEWHARAAAAEPSVTCPNVRGGGALGAAVLLRRGQISRALELVPVDQTALERKTFFDRALIDRHAALTGATDFAAALADSIYAQDDRLNWPDGLDAFVEALATLGRDEQVEQMLPVLRRQAVGDVRFAATADRVEAELLIKRGRPAEARPLLERALAWFQQARLPFESALTRELLGGVVAGAAGTDHLQAALATYEELDAVPYAERVRQALAA